LPASATHVTEKHRAFLREFIPPLFAKKYAVIFFNKFDRRPIVAMNESESESAAAQSQEVESVTRCSFADQSSAVFVGYSQILFWERS
jgi:hypothetical protein